MKLFAPIFTVFVLRTLQLVLVAVVSTILASSANAEPTAPVSKNSATNVADPHVMDRLLKGGVLAPVGETPFLEPSKNDDQNQKVAMPFAGNACYWACLAASGFYMKAWCIAICETLA